MCVGRSFITSLDQIREVLRILSKSIALASGCGECSVIRRGNAS